MTAKMWRLGTTSHLLASATAAFLMCWQSRRAGEPPVTRHLACWLFASVRTDGFVRAATPSGLMVCTGRRPSCRTSGTARSGLRGAGAGGVITTVARSRTGCAHGGDDIASRWSFETRPPRRGYSGTDPHLLLICLVVGDQLTAKPDSRYLLGRRFLHSVTYNPAAGETINAASPDDLLDYSSRRR